MFLAWKELKQNKAKYGLILMILVLIIFLVLFLTGLTKGLAAASSSSIDNSAANYYILDDSSDNLLSRSSVSKDDIEIIKDFTKDSEEINLNIANIFSKTDDSSKLNISYLGINPSGFLMPQVIEGNTLVNKNEIILDSSFKAEGFEIGDSITDATSEIKMTVVGFTKNQIYNYAPVGVISLETYTDLIKASTILKEVNSQGIALNIEDNEENITKLEEFINNNMEDKMLITKSTLINNLPGYSAQQGTLITMLVFLFAISSLIIAVFFYVTTMQKIPQFGVLKALGAKMSTLASSLASQVFILAAASAVIGNILTFISASFLPSSIPFILNYMDAILVSLLFLVISVGSSLFSIKKVKKVDAVSAIGGTY
jgi:putative ABC transport system permease protein